ncbi:hypothetical protein COLO4_22445 [Corchorus olitorius]|uniref:Rhodanese domain-containing protein n=1 Tax=Corchorus olitorius TaxID=93759 RepID=A0A1R3ILS9_9ROSI|nr:hypothetical protein COLO4_22445 [Corchorus olitorius]
MREALLGFSFVFIAYLIQLTSATVVLKPFSLAFPDLPAKFARGVNNTGICGALEVADPLDACTQLRNELGPNRTDPVRFALIIRGDCSFEEKIRHAQSGGFSAAIVYDDRDGASLVYMMVDPKGIEIQAVFIPNSAGEFLKAHSKGEKGECCIYPPHNGRAWTVFAICFLSLVVIAAFLAIAFIAPRTLSNWRGRRLVKSVDTKMVEALPRVVFSSARLSECCAGETCAICLEDYKDGEILKVLPCQHDQEQPGLESTIIGHVRLALLSDWCGVGSARCGSEEVVTINVIETKNLLQSGYGYIDVRTVEEYKKGHVDAEKIFNIPYMFNTPEGGRVKNPEFLKQVSSVCKEDDPLIVGCQSGVRSLYATADLQTIGFKNVTNMGGGYLAWADNKLSIKIEEPIKVEPVKLEEKPKEEL